MNNELSALVDVNKRVSGNNTNATAGADTLTLDSITLTLWITGISVSIICVIIQCVFYVVISKCRKFNENTLTQLTVARLINTIVELAMVDSRQKYSAETASQIVLRLFYLQSDMALLCWMFLFTKNMYDKIVMVELLERKNFLRYLFSVFTITLLLAIMYVVIPVFWDPLMFNKDNKYMETMYEIYVVPKFIVLLVNLLYFCKIFAVAQRANRHNRNVKAILKMCAIAFIFFLMSSIQVLVADFIHYLKLSHLEKYCYILNAYQIISTTAIFIISVKGRLPEGSFWKTFCKGFKESVQRCY